MKKILFAVTSHGELGTTGKPTGYYLSEVTHPYAAVTAAGFEVDIVSPKGGNPPAEGVDMTDPVNKRVWNDPAFKAKIENTLTPDKVNPEEYCAMFYAGGHGAVWDFPVCEGLIDAAQSIYRKGGVLAAVCHGVAGFLNLRTPEGDYLIKNRNINSFTNAEEIANGTDKAVPFMLETELKSRGCLYQLSDIWQVHISVNDRLVTGQNPMSAYSVGLAIVNRLQGPQADV